MLRNYTFFLRSGFFDKKKGKGESMMKGNGERRTVRYSEAEKYFGK